MDLILLWLLGALFFLPFGGSFEPTEDEVTVEPSAAASPVIDPIEEQFDRRSPLPRCGQWDVEHGYYEESAQPGWECLKEYANDTGAEALFRADSPDRGPTFTTVRVADGLMEIYENAPFDELRPWTYDSCPVEESSFRQGCP